MNCLTINTVELLICYFYSQKFLELFFMLWGSYYSRNYSSIMCSSLNIGQAKLSASFPFQDFQNMMWAGGHYSLFIIYIAKYWKLNTPNYKSIKDHRFPVKIILQDSHKILQDVQDIARWINLQEFWKFFLQVFFLLARLSLPWKPLARFSYASCKVVPNFLQDILLLRIITVKHIIVD